MANVAPDTNSSYLAKLTLNNLIRALECGPVSFFEMLLFFIKKCVDFFPPLLSKCHKMCKFVPATENRAQILTNIYLTINMAPPD